MSLPISPAQLKRMRKLARAYRRGAPVRARGVDSPKSVEANYYKALQRIVKKLTMQMSRKLIPLLKELESEYFLDSPGSAAFILLGAVDQLARQPAIAEETQERIALRMATSVEAFNRNKFVKEINEAIGVSLRNIIRKEGVAEDIRAAIERNVGLIKSIPEQYHDKVKKAISTGIESGDDFFSIRKQILEIGESTEKRARFIARDQTAKLNAAITRTRQSNLGIRHYFWRTSNDERVRPNHEDKEGERFAWSDPPADTGHPGEDYNCRCTAEPDLTGVLDELEAFV